MFTLATGETIRAKAGTNSALTYTFESDTIASGADAFAVQSQGQLTTSVTTISTTVPASTQVLIKQMHLANTTASTVSGIAFYRNGSTAGNQITGTFSISANGWADYADGVWYIYDSTGALITSTTITLSGDASGSLAGGNLPVTLATVNSNVGTFGSNTRIPTYTVNAKGLTTASSDAPVLTTPSGQTPVGATRAINTTAPLTGGGDLSADRTIAISPATTSTAGSLSAAQFSFLTAFNGPGIIMVTSNAYSNLTCNGSTDDLAALNALYSGAPDGSTLVWPGQNTTMVLSGAAVVPGGKHFIHVGGGIGNKTNVLQTSLTADHFTAGDWYSTWTGFNFTTNNTSATGVQALTSGTVLNVNPITTALIPATGSINIGSAIGWQVLTYSARTASTITLSSTGTGNSIAGIPIVFKTAGAAINAGNLVGIDCIGNSFTCCYNGYVCSGSTSNQSRISDNGGLNTINFNVQIDAANWNGIIDTNTFDCTTNSRTLSHLEINQCGSITGQGNQLIRGQSDMRLGSTTAAYPAGVFGVYFTNTFFDNAGADAIKFQGISAIQRVKITSSWISSAAAMGINFASTATTLPTDIEIIGCNIYSNGSNGIGGAGVADYSVIGGQVAGNVTAGVNMAPATGGVYSARLSGVRIGPTGGIGANGTGLLVAVGTYAQIKVNNCDVTGNTTNYTTGVVTVASWPRYAIVDSPGINPLAVVTTPAVAASTVAMNNSTGVRILVRLSGGTVTAYTINGVATGLVAAATLLFPLEPGSTLAITYSVVPTMKWIGQ